MEADANLKIRKQDVPRSPENVLLQHFLPLFTVDRKQGPNY